MEPIFGIAPGFRISDFELISVLESYDRIFEFWNLLFERVSKRVPKFVDCLILLTFQWYFTFIVQVLLV